MDDVKTESIGEIIERWAFIVLGSFTTACFTRNFTIFDLIATPQSFRGIIENEHAHFMVPPWLPAQNCIFRMDNGSLFSRLRDLPLKKTTRQQPDGQNLLSIKLPTDTNAEGLASLTYYPLFRFAHTGGIFDIGASPAELAVRIMDYASRRAGFSTERLPTENGVYTLEFRKDTETYKVTALGTDSRLDAFILALENTTLELNIKDHQLQLNSRMAENLTQAIINMRKDGRSLRNCDIDIIEECGVTYAQLAYRRV